MTQELLDKCNVIAEVEWDEAFGKDKGVKDDS